MSASNLRTAICELFTIHKTDQYRLADTSSVSLEKINEWMDHSYLMSHKDLIKLARAFNLPPKEYRKAHAIVLKGYLRDLRHGPGADLIFLDLLEAPNWFRTTYGIYSVTARMREDLEIIHAEICYNKELRALIRRAADFCRNQKQETK